MLDVVVSVVANGMLKLDSPFKVAIVRVLARNNRLDWLKCRILIVCRELSVGKVLKTIE